jgi:DNA-binding transcriptional MocR family regulator
MSTRTMRYGAVRGFGPLRAAIADHVRHTRGVDAAVEQVIR